MEGSPPPSRLPPLPGREGSGVGRPRAGVRPNNGPTHPQPLPFREGSNFSARHPTQARHRWS
ncbi:hypothetical protein EAH76_18180 [Sphingomonas glacialis]|uniref:Uncharacterized protein n=1 Tax=Sphingomonas glacialis TaxID=658225 RepID=A0A502FKM1_9SPHN|nr:hypothetical protein EAH76_18180 [Sphingomonas glacialis]